MKEKKNRVQRATATCSLSSRRDFNYEDRLEKLKLKKRGEKDGPCTNVLKEEGCLMVNTSKSLDNHRQKNTIRNCMKKMLKKKRKKI